MDGKCKQWDKGFQGDADPEPQAEESGRTDLGKGQWYLCGRQNEWRWWAVAQKMSQSWEEPTIGNDVWSCRSQGHEAVISCLEDGAHICRSIKMWGSELGLEWKWQPYRAKGFFPESNAATQIFLLCCCKLRGFLVYNKSCVWAGNGKTSLLQVMNWHSQMKPMVLQHSCIFKSHPTCILIITMLVTALVRLSSAASPLSAIALCWRVLWSQGLYTFIFRPRI